MPQIKPVDTALDTPAQLAAYSAAAKLGGGVPTYDSLHPVTPTETPAPAKEPTVISGANISDTVIPNLKKRADDVATKGTTVGQDGNAYYADGSAVPAPVDAEFDNGVWKSGGKSYTAAPQFVDNETNDPEVAQTNKILAGLKANLDSSTLGSVNAIEQQSDLLKSAQQEANDREAKSVSRTSMLGGSARYAPLNASGIALASASYGIRQLAKLDADENAAIAQVRQAQTSGNFQLMEKALATVDDIRKTKQDAAAKLADKLSAANDAANKQKIQASRDQSIASLLAQGITDPTKLLDYLNKYDDGTATGGDFTADEIKKAITNLTPTAEAKDLYKFTTTDVGKMLAAGLNAAEVQSVQDFYNGRGSSAILDALSPAEKTAVQTALAGKAATAAGGDDAFKFTSTQKSQLLSGNFTTDDIGKIQADIAQYGIDKVTEGMPDDQKKLVKRVLGTSDAVAGLGDEADSKLTRDAVSTFFGIPDNTDKGGLLGFGDTNQEALDKIMESIAKYQAVGYKDADILKMMQDNGN